MKCKAVGLVAALIAMSFLQLGSALADETIHCEVQNPEDPGDGSYWQEADFDPDIPKFTLIHHTKTDSGVIVREEALLNERSICGMDYEQPIAETQGCSVQTIPPSQGLPGRWITIVACAEANARVQIDFSAPFSRFNCQHSTGQGTPPVARFVLLRECK